MFPTAWLINLNHVGIHFIFNPSRVEIIMANNFNAFALEWTFAVIPDIISFGHDTLLDAIKHLQRRCCRCRRRRRCYRCHHQCRHLWSPGYPRRMKRKVI